MSEAEILIQIPEVQNSFMHDTIFFGVINTVPHNLVTLPPYLEAHISSLITMLANIET